MTWNNPNPNPNDPNNPYNQISPKGSRSGEILPSQFAGPLDAQNRKNYPFFRKLNLMTIILGGVHLFVFILMSLLLLIPDLQAGTLGMTNFLFKAVIPMIIGIAFLLYDIFVIRVQIENYSLQFYAMDIILIGVIGAVFVFGMGIYLVVKGVIMMFLSITERALFNWKFKRSFFDVIRSVFNLFGILYGFSILYFRNPWLIALNSTQVTYFYIALGGLILEALIIRPLTVNKKVKEIPLFLAIISMVIGISACFYFLAGIFIAIEGVFLTIRLIFLTLDYTDTRR